MPYLGNIAGNRFVASKAATQFSGDGSTTAFTLEHSVGSDEDILVSVDGVIQEPSVAYAVSSGTTLTFTAAPSSNSGNNIFVYYLFRTVATVDHPSTSSLQATDGTFTGDLTVDTSTLKVDSTNNRVGVGTATPLKPLHIEGSSEADVFLRRTDLTNKAWLFNVQSTNGNLNIKSRNDDASASSTSMIIGHDGFVLKPNQPAFSAHFNGTGITNFDNTPSAVALSFTHERFDTGTNFNTSNGTFTAPITGKYSLNLTVRINSIDTAATYYIINIVTSNETYRHIIDPNFSSDLSYRTFNVVILADMDENDTCVAQVLQSGGTQQSDIDGNPEYTYFSGHLVC